MDESSGEQISVALRKGGSGVSRYISGIRKSGPVPFILLMIVVISWAIVGESSSVSVMSFMAVIVMVLVATILLWRALFIVGRDPMKDPLHSSPQTKNASASGSYFRWTLIACQLSLVMGLATQAFGPWPRICAPIWAALTVALACVQRSRGLAWLLVLGCAVMLGILGFAITWGFANIDVFSMVTRDTARLLHGLNPYDFASPSIRYRTNLTTYFIPTDLNYGPTILFASAVGFIIGDVRVSDVVMLVITCAGLIWLLPRATGVDVDGVTNRWWLIALIVLNPFLLAMSRWDWTDAIMMGFFVLWLVLREKKSQWVKWCAIGCLGLALGVKVTLVVSLLPLVLWNRKLRIEGGIGIIVAGVIYAPFAIWDGFRPFFHATVIQLLDVSVRTDELTLQSAWYHATGTLPSGIAFAAVSVIVIGAILCVRVRTWEGAWISSALCTLVFFLLSKMSSANYYYDVVILCYLALVYGPRLLPGVQAITGSERFRSITIDGPAQVLNS